MNEIEILTALQGTTDPRQRQRLIERLIQAGGWTAQIRTACRPYRGRADHDDLAQAGYLGLLRAVSSYRGGDGSGWHTYAWTWIKKSLQRAVRQAGPLVPEGDQDYQARVLVARDVAQHGQADLDRLAAQVPEPTPGRRSKRVSRAALARALAGGRDRAWAELDPGHAQGGGEDTTIALVDAHREREQWWGGTRPEPAQGQAQAKPGPDRGLVRAALRLWLGISDPDLDRAIIR